MRINVRGLCQYHNHSEKTFMLQIFFFVLLWDIFSLPMKIILVYEQFYISENSAGLEDC